MIPITIITIVYCCTCFGYINIHNAKSPHSLTDVHTLTLWITRRSQEFDVITMFILPEPQSRKISNVHKLNMMFDQQEHFTVRRVSLHETRRVLSRYLQQQNQCGQNVKFCQGNRSSQIRDCHREDNSFF